MICHRRAVPALALLGLLALAIAPGAARAQGFQAFVPLLVDLDGWTGSKAEGMAMEVPGNNMVTAGRDYQRGDARLHAQVIVGPAAQGALAATQSGIKIETSEARMSTSTVDGFPTTRSFNFADKSGAILVALANNAVFTVSFNNLPEDDALALAKKFDWKAIQARLPK